MKCMKINPAEYKILVVDDVQSNVLLLKALLGREGFGIVYAMNGTEAEVTGKSFVDVFRTEYGYLLVM